jgi:TonB family protein
LEITMASPKAIAGLLAFVTAATLQAQTPASSRVEPYSPALLTTGGVPALPEATTVGACEVAVEITVDATGAPAAVDVLRSTDPCTALLTAAVKGWRFKPADEAAPAEGTVAAGALAPRNKVRSRVLAVAVVNAPALMGPTLGSAPVTRKQPSAEIPWPATISAPGTSPVAFTGSVTMVEARVSATGRVESARVIRSGPPYDDASLALVKSWSFTAARRAGRSVPSNVYVMFGFPTPTVSPTGPPPCPPELPTCR